MYSIGLAVGFLLYFVIGYFAFGKNNADRWMGS